MPAFRKPPQADPAQIAQIQALVTPLLADLQQRAWGNPRAFQQIPDQIKRALAAKGVQLPPGYDVTMDGEVVYTNQTPWLQQAAWATLPFAAGQAASSLSGLLTGPAATGTTGTLGGVYGGPAAVASQGASQGARAGGGGLWSTIGKFFGGSTGGRLIDLAGHVIGTGMQVRGANRAADLAGRYNTEALEFLKAQDARDYADYLQERNRRYGYEDVDRGRAEEDRQLRLLRERERETRLAPFRQGAERGYQTLSSLLYNPAQPFSLSPAVSGATTRR